MAAGWIFPQVPRRRLKTPDDKVTAVVRFDAVP
jgi:hypothetical protein